MMATGFVQKHEAKGQEPVFFLLKSDHPIRTRQVIDHVVA